MSGARRRPLALAVALAAAFALAPALALTPAAAVATTVRASGPSFGDLEAQFMCVVCHEPLAVAQSPESFQERQYLRTLIAQRRTPSEIRAAMVEAYTPAVLASPPASGFNLLVYVVPPAAVVLGVALIVLALPRWRRRSRAAQAQRAPTAAALDPADARRLDDELGRFA